MDLKPSFMRAGSGPVVGRAMTRVSGQHGSPRVSTLGSLLALLIVASLASFVTLAVFLSNVNGRLQVQAEQINDRFESLVSMSLAELDVTGPLTGVGCDPGGLDVLTQQSLKSRILDQIHWRDGRSGEICSPIRTSQPAVQAWYESAQTQLNTNRPAVLLTASENGLLVARESVNGDALIGELRTGDLRLHLGDAEAGSYRAVVRRPDGTILFDSTGLFRPGSTEARDRIGPGLSAQSLLYAVKVQSASPRYPIEVELMPTPLTLIKTGSRYLLTAITLSGVLTLLLIAVFNQYLAKRISVERRLKIALNRRSFVPVIQPIVDAQTGRCKGGEVLMRWDHPARGLVSPEEFLPVAERLGLMGSMTIIIMEKACLTLAGLARKHPQLYFSFNVDASQLRDPLFPEQLSTIFHDDSIPPSQVLLEIVEREAVDEQARVGLDRLRSAGYRIAIDDFGTGQSSLGLLLAIGFDVLKIDRSFVSAVDGSQVNRPVLDAIIEMAQKLDVVAVAEGVETVEQHAFLVARGVDAIQGYLVSKPMPVKDFPAWVLDSKHRPPAYSDSPGSGTIKNQCDIELARSQVEHSDHDRATSEEAAASLRHLRQTEARSCGQNFRLSRTGELLHSQGAGQSPGLALGLLMPSSGKPQFMPV